MAPMPENLRKIARIMDLASGLESQDVEYVVAALTKRADELVAKQIKDSSGE